MRNVRFHHIRGQASWLRHHHHQTAIDAAGMVRLGTDEELDDTPSTDIAPWQLVRTSGVLVPVSPVRAGCAPWGITVGGEDGPVLVTEDASAQPTRPSLDGRVSAVARDSYGRLWFVRPDHDECWLYDFDDDEARGRVPLPPGSEPADLAFDTTGAYVVDAAHKCVWYRPDAGNWHKVEELGAASPVSACTLGGQRVAVIVHAPDGHRLLLLRAGAIRAEVALATLESPLHCVGVGEDRIVIAEVDGEPGATTRFHAFELGAALAPLGRPLEVHAFDGRALVADSDGVLWATTDRGLRKLYNVRPRYRTRGGVETVALDSSRYGCTWHRVFVDACLPEGTSVRLYARAADEPYPAALTVEPAPPASPQRPDAIELGFLGSQAPLGSTPLDEEGWTEVGLLDERRAFADLPWPPPNTGEFATYEGLLKVPKGRYLWLRIVLEGTHRRTPQVHGVRASYPRPSLLRFLPPYWSADDAQAERVERFLALFEAELTQLDERVSVLRHLFDPHVAPSEALDWLGSCVAMSLDKRLPEPVRRELLANAVELYRTRGTVVGLKMLAETIAEVPVHILEGFRLRRRGMPVLGEDDDEDARSVLGEGLQLGSAPRDDTRPEERLAEAWDQAFNQRERRLEATAEACPPRVPPRPRVDRNYAYYNRFAHRFTVVVSGELCAERLAALDDAIDAWKPAHTVHSICSFDEGMAPGIDAYVGIGTWVGDDDEPAPTTLSDDAVVLGAGSTIGIWTGTPNENTTETT